MTSMLSAWWGWLAASSLQALAVLAVVALLDVALGRRAWPHLRAGLWAVVLVELCVPPWLALPTSAWRAAGASARPLLLGDAWSPAPGLVLTAASTWLAGVAGVSTCLLVRHVRTRRAWTGPRAQAAPSRVVALAAEAARRLRLRTTPRVLVHADDLGPAMMGLVRPVVVLPRGLVATGTRLELEHALLHELAHVKRRDAWSALACLLVQVAWWFHPAAWLAGRRLAELRELCCDQAVAGVLGTATDEYRTTLASFALRRADSPTGASLAFLHPRARILARLQALDRPGVRRPGLRRAVTAAVVGVLVACVVPLAPAPPLRLMGMEIPPAAELQGCLQRRHVVLALLARERAAAASLTPDASPENRP